MEFDKSKVYTALNADESLIGAKGYFAESLCGLIRLVKSDFYKPEGLHTIESIDEDSILANDCGTHFNFFYLIEPAPSKPKYRPFKDCDELIDYFCQKHSIPKTDWGMPFIWVKDKTHGYKWLVTEIFTNGVTIGSDNEVTQLSELLDDYTFLDGSVCGVEE